MKDIFCTLGLCMIYQLTICIIYISLAISVESLVTNVTSLAKNADLWRNI
jgi:hypothetical protein